MLILAIDPGTTQSGFVFFDGDKVHAAGVMPNDEMLRHIRGFGSMLTPSGNPAQRLAIEKIEAMGMAVGAETFETVHWSGRFWQAWPGSHPPLRITRRAVKLHLCGSSRAKDPNVRQALIDTVGPQGTKKAPGPTYGVASHAWPALAVAVVALHELRLLSVPEAA